MAPIFPTTLSLTARSMNLTGHVTGWFIVASSAGAMVIPLVIGQAFSPIGPQSLILVTTTTMTIAIGVMMFLIHNLSGKEMKLIKEYQ
jgi:fucose permease